MALNIPGGIKPIGIISRERHKCKNFSKERICHTAEPGMWSEIKTWTGLAKGSFQPAELVARLEEIEEHGDQYVFLYDLDFGWQSYP